MNEMQVQDMIEKSIQESNSNPGVYQNKMGVGEVRWQMFLMGPTPTYLSVEYIKGEGGCQMKNDLNAYHKY